jgi:hypothetical protein
MSSVAWLPIASSDRHKEVVVYPHGVSESAHERREGRTDLVLSPEFDTAAMKMVSVLGDRGREGGRTASRRDWSVPRRIPCFHSTRTYPPKSSSVPAPYQRSDVDVHGKRDGDGNVDSNLTGIDLRLELARGRSRLGEDGSSVTICTPSSSVRVHRRRRQTHIG